jgi:hypothetical protein
MGAQVCDRTAPVTWTGTSLPASLIARPGGSLLIAALTEPRNVEQIDASYQLLRWDRSGACKVVLPLLMATALRCGGDL